MDSPKIVGLRAVRDFIECDRERLLARLEVLDRRLAEVKSELDFAERYTTLSMDDPPGTTRLAIIAEKLASMGTVREPALGEDWSQC